MFKKAFKAVISVATVMAMMPAPVHAASSSAVSLPSVAINPDQGYQMPAPRYKVTETKRVKKRKSKRYITVKKTIKKKYKNVTWTTNATNIRVSRSGYVTPLKAGSATVYGRSGNKAFSKKITVRYYHEFEEVNFGKGQGKYTASSYADVAEKLIHAIRSQKDDCLITCTDSFHPSRKKMNELGDYIGAQMTDWDETCGTSMLDVIKGRTYWYTFSYQYNTKVEKKLDTEAKRLTRNIRGNAIDRALAINEILKPDRYDFKFQAATSYNAIMDHTAICQGYSAGFQRLGKACGLQSCYIYVKDHVWNLFRYNGRWYTIDTTWNSPQGVGVTIDYRYEYIDGRFYHVPYYFAEGIQLPEHDDPLKCKDNSMFTVNTLAKVFDKKQA